MIPQAEGQKQEGRSGGGSQMAPPSGVEEIPPWVQDVDIWGPPWFQSDWQSVSSGALPEEINLTVRIKGFPKGLGALFGHSLKYGKKYRVKVWVRNGAGLEKEAGVTIINIVREIPKEKNGNKTNVPEKGNRL